MKIQHSNLIFTNCGCRVRALYQSSHSEQIKSDPGDHKKYADKGESRKGWRGRPLVVIYSTRSCPPRHDAVCVWRILPEHVATLSPPSVTAATPALISIYYSVPSTYWISTFILFKNTELCVSELQSEPRIKVDSTYSKTPPKVNTIQFIRMSTLRFF